MKCPKCGGLELKIDVTFAGTVSIQCQPDSDEFEVTDSEPTDSEWDDNSNVYCFGCGNEGSVSEFSLADLIAEEDLPNG